MIAIVTTSFDMLSLGKDSSRRLRTLLRNACALVGMATEQLKALGAFPQDAPRSTVARYLSDEVDQIFTPRFAKLCVAWLAEFTGCSQDEIRNFLFSGHAITAELRELSCSFIFAHTAAQVSAFDTFIARAQAETSTHWMLRDVPPACLLPESAMQRVYRRMTQRSAEPFNDFRIELDHGRARRRRFDQRGDKSVGEFKVILTRTGLGTLIGPAASPLLNTDERDLFIETLLDRMETHGVRLGLIDDRPGRPGAKVRAFLDRFDALIGFDRNISVRRRLQGISRLVYESAGSPAQAEVVNADAELFALAERYSDFDQESVSERLLERASDGCWRKRRQQHDASF